MAPSLVYTGFANGGSSAFPVLLTGSGTATFWSSGQSVLELAPQEFVHTAGLVMFPSVAGTDPEITLQGAASSTYSSGDGLEAYLFMSPTNPVNWGTPYYATDPEGANSTFETPQGAVIFPFSSTPYIVVQWDPAFGAGDHVLVYAVTPDSSGVVSPSMIGAAFVGTGSGVVAHSSDYIGLDVNYDSAANAVSGAVTDQNTGTSVVTFNATLAGLGFSPSYSPNSQYYFGAGGSGNSNNGWGLLYLSVTNGAASSTPSSSSGVPILDVLLIALAAFAVVAVAFIVLVNRKK